MASVRLVVVAAAAVMGVSLADCSAMPDWMTPSMPDWLSSKPAGPQPQALRIESDPAGAEVRSAQGETCLTPCALTVPSETQSVTISKEGFVPQTVQVSVGEPPEHSFWESAPPPTLLPNPVQVALQAAPPPKPIHRPRRTVSQTRTEAKAQTPQARSPSPFPDPPRGQPQPAASPFPPPQPAASPFPPPPSAQ